MGPHSFAHRHLQDQQRGALRLDESDPRSDRNRSPAVADRRTLALVVRPHLLILRSCRHSRDLNDLQRVDQRICSPLRQRVAIRPSKSLRMGRGRRLR